MIHYIILALTLVSACAGDNPSKPILLGELKALNKLMEDIEARIAATSKAQATALNDADLACWALNLGSFKAQVETAYQNALAALKAELQNYLDQASTMSPSELDHLEDILIDGSEKSLSNRLSSALQTFDGDAASIMGQLAKATSFTCPPSTPTY